METQTVDFNILLSAKPTMKLNLFLVCNPLAKLRAGERLGEPEICTSVEAV
jgi:hypothetical protein